MVNLWHSELKCESSKENRENIQWIFNGRYVFDGDFDKDFKIDKNILKIKNIQLYHTGQYECSGMDITEFRAGVTVTLGAMMEPITVQCSPC